LFRFPKTIAVIVLVAGGLLRADNDDANPSHRLLTDRIQHRIIKSFDFDERRLGNFEKTPMNWRRIAAPGFPRFLEAAFDESIGHDAPPSFHLPLQSGSIGLHYLAKDIPVHPDSDYRVTAWILPKNLSRAGASIKAYFLDDALQKIPGSERQGAPIHGDGKQGRWAPVAFDLPGGFESARWIGLSCLVEQPSPAPADRAQPFEPIHRHEMHGAAWFDDITVLRLPRVSLTMDAPAGVFEHDRPVGCTVRIADLDGRDMTIDFDVFDADGRNVESQRLSDAALAAGHASLRLEDQPAGLYVAQLSTRVAGQLVSTYKRTFLRLNPDPMGNLPAGDPLASERSGGLRPGAPAGSRGFGIVANASLLTHRHIGEHFLRILEPQIVKIPLWRSGLTDEGIVRGDRNVDGLVETLHRRGVEVVGLLEAPPPSLAMQYEPHRRSLLTVLSSDANRWRPYLALILTRHGHRISAWQLGPDAGDLSNDPKRLPQALTHVRAEMQPLIGRPELVIPRSIHRALPAENLDADVLSLSIPSHQASGRLEEQTAGFRGRGFKRFWATVQPLEADRFEHRPRSVEFVRRLVEARCSGVDTVFVPQPWHVEKTPNGPVVTPAEEIIFLRTLAGTLNGLTPTRQVWAGPGVRAWLFENQRRTTGVLVAWTDAGATGNTQPLRVDVGDEARQIDMWGNVTRPKTETDGSAFAAGPMPTVIAPVAPWRIKMLSDFAVDEPLFQPTVHEHPRVLTFTNTLEEKLNGELELTASAGWRISPRRLPIDLAPGETARLDFTMRLPSNQAAGDYVLRGRLTGNGDDLPDIVLRAPLKVGAPGLEVSVLAYRDGGELRVMQRITNRTGRTLDLRAFLISPNRGRETRTIRNLAAGQTAIREYGLDNPSALAGKHIRCAVEQIGGALRHNTVLKLD